jgi:hypothetical protein
MIAKARRSHKASAATYVNQDFKKSCSDELLVFEGCKIDLV